MGARKRRRTEKAGFYEQRKRPLQEAPMGEEEEIRRRLREALYRTPEEKRLLIEALRVMSGGKESKSRETAKQMMAMLDSLGEQLGPERNSEW